LTLLFVSLLFLLSLLFEFCSPSLTFGWCCFCPPLVTIGAGGFVNMLLFCCCCCCCCCEREREDVSHRESTKRDDTFSTERARTRKGVRGKEVLRRRRRRLPFVFKKSTNVFVFNPKQREEFVRKKKAKKKAQKKNSNVVFFRQRKPAVVIVGVLFLVASSICVANTTTNTSYYKCTYRRRERVERPGIREKRVRRDSVGHFGASRASCAVRSTRARSRFRKGFPFFFLLPSVTPQNDSDKVERMSFFF
jgi:hypothetical protein